VIPKTLHFEAPSPKIDFATSPFFVARERASWPEGATPRRAGVSSFGVGGTNAHVVVEEPPLLPATGPSRPHQLLVVSARTSAALDRATARLADHLERNPELPLADVAYTLQAGRKAFAQRRCVVAADPAEAVAALRGTPPPASRQALPRPASVAFLFPGQGSQYVHMGRGLYRDEPVFREVMDRCAEVLRPVLGLDLRSALYGERPLEEAAEALKATALTQPALFAVEYALARQLMHWGIVPESMIGHSVGEFVCGALSGVFSLEDALRLVGERGRLMQRQPEGSMLSVRLGAEAVRGRLEPGLSVASDNGPSLCVVAGPHEAVARAEASFTSEGVVCRRLQTSHAFHSAMMDEAIEPFAAIARSVPLEAPRIPFVSTATGTWIRPEEATDPYYWARHLRATVLFAPGVRALFEEKDRVLLEVGPRATLATLARQQAPDKSRVVVSSLSDTAEGETEPRAVLAALGQLWLAGASPDWDAFHDLGLRRRVSLPTYPFERIRFWIDPARAAQPRELFPESAVTANVAEAALPIPSEETMPQPTASLPSAAAAPRQERLVPELARVLEEVSGVEISLAEKDASFMELGLDSLALTQVAQQIQKAFGVKVTFRQMMEACPSLSTLAEYLDGQLPAEAFAAEAEAPAAAPVAAAVAVAPVQVAMAAAPYPTMGSAPVAASAPGSLQWLIDQQLQLMRQQLMLMGGGGVAPAQTPPVPLVQVAAPVSVAAPQPAPAPAPAPTPAPAAA
ncbi:MAG TPA: acyltransferase domain-containing protein, partial [Vicinamibacteria bacterium]|nr:acyltransferase domain-containing protein [Vicinamibacteria bacterium]